MINMWVGSMDCIRNNIDSMEQAAESSSKDN